MTDPFLLPWWAGGVRVLPFRDAAAEPIRESIQPSWSQELLRAFRRLAPRYPAGVEMEMLRSHFIYAVAYRADMPSLTPQQWIEAFEETLAPFVANGEIVINDAGRLLAQPEEPCHDEAAQRGA